MNEIVDKKFLEENLVKVSFVNKQTMMNLNYVDGIEILSKTVNQNTPKHPAFIYKFEKGISIEVVDGFHTLRVPCLYDQINTVQVIKKGELVQDKSFVGRAVVGAVLLGPLGAILGGMSSMKKDVISDYVFAINYNGDDGAEKSAVFDVAEKHVKQVSSGAKEIFGAKFIQ